MDATEMVKQLAARRNSILGELKLITAKISELEELLSRGYTVDVPIPPELKHALQDSSPTRPKETRIPLSARRVALRDFLASAGPSTRAQIVAGTGIPAGSLSALLANPEIESTTHGQWKLRGTPDAPHEDD